MVHSNLDCFLKSSTPSVPSQFLPKKSIWNLNPEWQPIGKDRVEYFNLSDLWDCYDEWSAYGLESTIQIRAGNVVQYYTPYLSAIQIYTAKPISPRLLGEFCDSGSDVSSWSSESDDTKLSRSSSSNSSDKMWDMDDINSSVDDQWSVKDRRGELYMEHFEGDGPFARVPLKIKVDALSRKYPGLKTFNNLDLSPASWMAVAWYPIYHIPACKNGKELYASFLTYHTLSSSFQDNSLEDAANFTETQKETSCKENRSTISLPPFGVASYRMQPKVWLNHETSDHERLLSLSMAASSWLKQLQVQHHDFNFFISHSM